MGALILKCFVCAFRKKCSKLERVIRKVHDQAKLFARIDDIGAEGIVEDVGDEFTERFFNALFGTGDDGRSIDGFGAIIGFPRLGDITGDDIAGEFVFAEAAHFERANGELALGDIGADDGSIFTAIGGIIEAVAERFIELFVFFATDGTFGRNGRIVDGEVREIGGSERYRFRFEG